MNNIVVVDNSGFFLFDDFISSLDSLPPSSVSVPCPNGFSSPRWNGLSWVEGRDASELSNILKQNSLISLDSQRDEELRGFVIDNIFYNENIIFSMSVSYNISLDIDSIEWIGHDNQLLTFSKSDFGDLIKLGSQRVKEIYFKYRQLKDKL